MTTYWFMRMKQGSKGKDFTEELWTQGLVGVLFGSWSIEHLQGKDGELDESMLSPKPLKERCPQPDGITLTDRFLGAPRALLFKVSVGDRILVAYNGALHMGTVSEGFIDDPDGSTRGEFNERFKCRPVEDRRPFPLADLPSSYRLIAGTGRSAIQKVSKYRGLVEILDDSGTPEKVIEKLTNTATIELLGLLSPIQWEVVCNEYLRHRVGLRSLLLDVGRTLQAVDIYGVDQDGRRVLAQCKNDSRAWSRTQVSEWLRELPKKADDVIYFFNRGGVEGAVPGCEVVDGEDVAEWLELDSAYLKHLKTL